MANINPFSLEFGVQPPEYIDRFREASDIIEDFRSLYPSTHVYALLGPRGCGKTVLLNEIVEKLDSDEGWISVNLNTKSDLLLQLAAALDSKAHSSFSSKLAAEFSFSFSFFSLTLKGKEEVSDIHVLLKKMLSALSKHNIKVLVGLDDVSPNEYIEVFIKEFQLLRGQHMPIYLIMTGLYSVFNSIQNTDGLTFLQRTPKVFLGPLNYRAIEGSYASVLGVQKEKALELAAFTKGYAFAFQVLGYLMVKYGKKDIDEGILAKLDYYLEEGVYGKLWDELTQKEKEIVTFLAKKGSASNEDLIASGILSSTTIASYKRSLSQKGVVDISKRANMTFALPRFAEFALSRQ